MDVHALRHTYNTLLAVSGVSLEIRQQLMRHTDSKLTSNTYLDVQAFDLAGAVEKIPLPSLSQPATEMAGVYHVDATRLAGRLAEISTSQSPSVSFTGNPDVSGVWTEAENSPAFMGDFQQSPITVTHCLGGEENSAGRTRTYDIGLDGIGGTEGQWGTMSGIYRANRHGADCLIQGIQGQ